jgi:hypothetical protein
MDERPTYSLARASEALKPAARSMYRQILEQPAITMVDGKMVLRPPEQTYTDDEIDAMIEQGSQARRAREAELEALRATPEYQAKLAALEAAIEAVEPEDQPGWGEW